ncbi:MAG: hypothetical protein NVSMB65_05180 [Chloroflexota bacterium]
MMTAPPQVPAAELVGTPLGLLHHLWAMTRRFSYNNRGVAYLRIYAQPAQEDQAYPLRFIEARETGYEGIACLDDTARAAVLALGAYEATGNPRALSLAIGWLNFVEYMQDDGGRFSNFIVDEFGTKNLTGLTSLTGGYGWTARALWALARAWRLTGDVAYLRRFSRCPRPQNSDDMKMNGLTAVALLELCPRPRGTVIEDQVTALCDAILDARAPQGYVRDFPGAELVHLWGYHQLLAIARAGHLLERRDYLDAAEQVAAVLVRPVVDAGFYYSWPPGIKQGLTAYCITPLVQGLAALYRATGTDDYRTMALRGYAWLTGANDAALPLYDPATGRCADGLDPEGPSVNCGAESSIEAGLAELERRALEP